MNSGVGCVFLNRVIKVSITQISEVKPPGFFFFFIFSLRTKEEPKQVLSPEKRFGCRSNRPSFLLLLLSPVELAMIMDRLYGGVCYAGIDTDPELKYPKGAGRVAFSNQQSYIAAISARFVQLQHNDIDKRVSEFMHSIHSVLPLHHS